MNTNKYIGWILAGAFVLACFLAIVASPRAQSVNTTPSRGPMGLVGSTGAAGTNGTNAVATAARPSTDTSGGYAWTYPSACLNAGHVPFITAIAEGPSPQSGTNVNVQLEGVPTATAATFRVTKTQSTTVALLGLTITVSITGTSIGATVLDLGCSPQ